MRYKPKTKHDPPPTSKVGDKLQLNIAKLAIKSGHVQPRSVAVQDADGVVHRVTLNAQLYCGAEPPTSKLTYDAPTCVHCVVARLR